MTKLTLVPPYEPSPASVCREELAKLLKVYQSIEEEMDKLNFFSVTDQITAQTLKDEKADLLDLFVSYYEELAAE